MKFFRRRRNKEKDCCEGPYFMNHGHLIPVHLPCCHGNDDFRLNLAGLTGNVNFKLSSFVGCDVEINTTFGTTKMKERGKICGVGIDFIDLKNENGMVVTILKDRVSQIRWLDDDCHPCVENDLESESS